MKSPDNGKNVQCEGHSYFSNRILQSFVGDEKVVSEFHYLVQQFFNQK